MQALTSIFMPRQLNIAEVVTKEDAQSCCANLLLLTEITYSALQCLQRGRLRCFDALVGETSCQLRAARVQQLASNREFVESAVLKSEQLARISGELRKLLKTLEAPKTKIKAADFQEAMMRKVCSHIPIKIHRDDVFLALSHALFVTRDHEEPTKTNEENLREFLPSVLGKFAPSTCRLIVTKAKRELATMSVDYLQKVAKGQSVSMGHLIKKSVVNSCDLDCVPCFLGLEVLLKESLKQRLPIALKIERVGKKQLLLPFVSQDGRTFSPLDASTMDQSTPVLLIEGATSSKARKAQYTEQLLGPKDAIEEFPHSRIMSVILMNAAAHPQYAGGRKNAEIEFLGPCVPFAQKVAKEGIQPLIASAEDVEKVVAKGLQYDVVRAKKAVEPAKISELTLSLLRMRALKARALKEGCHSEDSSLFAIKHILCSRIGDENAKIGKTS